MGLNVLGKKDFEVTPANVSVALGFHKAAREATPEQWNMVQKLSKKMSPEEFTKYIETKEIPPIKLNKEEMEALKGGIFWVLIIVVLVVMATCEGEDPSPTSGTPIGPVHR